MAQDIWSLKPARFYGKIPSRSSWWFPKSMMDLSKNWFVVPWRTPAAQSSHHSIPCCLCCTHVILATYLLVLLSMSRRVCAGVVCALDWVNSWKSTHVFANKHHPACLYDLTPSFTTPTSLHCNVFSACSEVRCLYRRSFRVWLLFAFSGRRVTAKAK